jgi:hypothetical protein
LPGAIPPHALRTITRRRLRIGAFWRGRPADALHTCWLAVATGTFTVTAFPPRVETPRGFSLSQPTVSDHRRLPHSGFAVFPGRVRPQPVGMGELCPGSPPASAAMVPGSRARQLHPTVIRLPGIIAELLASEFLAHSLWLSFSQRTERSLSSTHPRSMRIPPHGFYRAGCEYPVDKKAHIVGDPWIREGSRKV